MKIRRDESPRLLGSNFMKEWGHHSVTHFMPYHLTTVRVRQPAVADMPVKVKWKTVYAAVLVLAVQLVTGMFEQRHCNHLYPKPDEVKVLDDIIKIIIDVIKHLSVYWYFWKMLLGFKSVFVIFIFIGEAVAYTYTWQLTCITSVCMLDKLGIRPHNNKIAYWRPNGRYTHVVFPRKTETVTTSIPTLLNNLLVQRGVEYESKSWLIVLGVYYPDVVLGIGVCTLSLKHQLPNGADVISERLLLVPEWAEEWINNRIYRTYCNKYKICYFRITLFSFLITSLNLTFPMVYTTYKVEIEVLFRKFYRYWNSIKIFNFNENIQDDSFIAQNSLKKDFIFNNEGSILIQI
ncbi:hypothetical protein AGLY_004813 [Aphis glycines]|uniref:Uncharacterized protein n=1 Tax=Aphis glycines TaxID=307491 RepID=A0A6G0TV35_APHGL|nr:hypothetical protein AGLY_004813 [Aphis glycines]